MPTKRRPLSRVAVGSGLSSEQIADLQSGYPAAFPNEQARRSAWRLARAAMLEAFRPGLRPAGWWDYEAKAARDDRMSQRQQLCEMGAMTAAEVTEFEPRWLLAEARIFERAEDDAEWNGASPAACYHRFCLGAGIPRNLRRQYPGETAADRVHGRPVAPLELLRNWPAKAA